MGERLKTGEILVAESGKEYKVLSLIYTGGQFEKYHVEHSNIKYELCLYWHGSNHEIHKCKRLIDIGAPSSNFQWPKDIIYTHDTFGLVCKYVPEGYKGWVDLVKMRVTPSFDVICRLCEELCSRMKELHEHGFALLAEYDFLFDPESGHVIATVWDKISRGRLNIHYIGTPRLSAPEIVRGESKTTRNSDLYVLAIYLFYILFLNHPLEGAQEAKIKCLDPATMLQLYGRNPVFIFDPNNDTNRPVPGYQDNAIIYWSIYPQCVKDIFIKCFTEGINNIYKRPTEDEWIAVFEEMRRMITKCPNCGAEVFMDYTKEIICWNCGCRVRMCESDSSTSGLKRILKDNSLIWKEHKRFKAFLHDYYPDNRIVRNLVFACVTEGIIDEMLMVQRCNDNQKYRFSKRLMDSYGCDYSRAEEVIALWIDALGIEEENQEWEEIKDDLKWEIISDMTIDELELSVETYRQLKSLGYTVGEIVKKKNAKYLIELLEKPENYHEGHQDVLKALDEQWEIQKKQLKESLDMMERKLNHADELLNKLIIKSKIIEASQELQNQNYKKAIVLYEDAVKLGYKGDYSSLALAYLSGEKGIEIDFSKGFKWLNSFYDDYKNNLLSLDDLSGVVKTCYALGVCYLMELQMGEQPDSLKKLKLDYVLNYWKEATDVAVSDKQKEKSDVAADNLRIIGCCFYYGEIHTERDGIIPIDKDYEYAFNSFVQAKEYGGDNVDELISEMLANSGFVNQNKRMVIEYCQLETIKDSESACYKWLLDNSILDIPIEGLDLGIRAYNCLKRAGIKTVRDLTHMTFLEIAHIRNMGRKSAEAVKDRLDHLGLKLASSDKE